MRLVRVQIKNFKSIKESEVRFDPPCRILVGINEAGKSNTLNALALLSNDRNPNKKEDRREALPEENQIDKASVLFVFKFDKNESDKLFQLVSDKILASAKNPETVTHDGRKESLKDFCIQRNESLLDVNILQEDKTFSYWSVGEEHKILPNWKKPTAQCPADFAIDVNGEKYQISKYKLIRQGDFAGVPDEYLEEAEIEDLDELVGSEAIKITKESIPSVLVWKYDEKNLLPASVSIADFGSNPDTCVPLKNMFNLAGIENIKATLDEEREGTDNQFQNFLDRVSRKTTNHFRAVWKEYRNIEFSLRLNADQIIPGVKEINTLDFAKRSDGFKRFVTFLLIISVNVKTNNLRNTLLLIDEPDTSLHPSGARYLRDELIRISKTNYVLYSTHSIFMIDSGDIGRHYIVKKKDEVSFIESAKESNVADEEVLFNALGHSVFSILKEKNIIFEGWKDKHLFQIALGNATADIKRKYKEIGICHARGAKSIKAITPLIELAKRECLIISDSDAPAKEQQKLYKQENGYGEWKTYQDIDSSVEAVTGEDFVKNEFLVRQIKSVLSRKAMPAFDDAILPDKKAKLVTLASWLINNGMTGDQVKDTLTEVKNAVFENLKYHNIEDTYTKLLKGIPL